MWDLLDDEFEAAILLDTDIIVAHSMDSCFNLVQHADIAGCFRGTGNFSLTSPRPSSTIKTHKKVAKARGKGKTGGAGSGGGINGGVIVFKPNRTH